MLPEHNLLLPTGFSLWNPQWNACPWLHADPIPSSINLTFLMMQMPAMVYQKAPYPGTIEWGRYQPYAREKSDFFASADLGCWPLLWVLVHFPAQSHINFNLADSILVIIMLQGNNFVISIFILHTIFFWNCRDFVK